MSTNARSFLGDYAFVLSLNVHCRHLTAEQTRGTLIQELKRDSSQSDRSAAAFNVGNA